MDRINLRLTKHTVEMLMTSNKSSNDRLNPTLGCSYVKTNTVLSKDLHVGASYFDNFVEEEAAASFETQQFCILSRRAPSTCGGFS